MAISLAAGCAFTPKPVFIANKPSFGSPAEPLGLRVKLRVKDARSEAVQQARMVGIVRNGYMMATSIAFGANPEPLDQLVAYHAKLAFENAGYEVVDVEPAAPATLGSEKLSAPPAEKARVKGAMQAENSAWRTEATRGGQTPEGKELQDLGPERARESPDSAISGKPVVPMVELTIESFGSDFLQAIVAVSVQAWTKFEMSVAQDASDARQAHWRKSLRSFGTSGPRAVVTAESYNVAVNMAYWIALNSLEEVIRSEEFKQAVSGGVRR